MAVVTIVLTLLVAALTVTVLADSGLRLWSAIRRIGAQRAAISGMSAGVPQARTRQAVRAAATSNASRPAMAAPLRAAA